MVDDDVELCELLQSYLATQSISVHCEHDGAAGLAALNKEPWQIIVLDIMLPIIDGIGVLQAIRKQSNVPVLMLTARGDDIDRILGLEMGADDYLPKPCNPRELAARLRAIVRRAQGRQQTTETRPPEKIQCQEISLLSKSRQVFKETLELSLTAAEYNLLEHFLTHLGEVITKAELTEVALARKLERYDRSIDVHVSNLRKKLGDSSGNQPRIKTVRGVGYVYLAYEDNGH